MCPLFDGPIKISRLRKKIGDVAQYAAGAWTLSFVIKRKPLKQVFLNKKKKPFPCIVPSPTSLAEAAEVTSTPPFHLLQLATGRREWGSIFLICFPVDRVLLRLGSLNIRDLSRPPFGQWRGRVYLVSPRWLIKIKCDNYSVSNFLGMTIWRIRFLDSSIKVEMLLLSWDNFLPSFVLFWLDLTTMKD